MTAAPSEPVLTVRGAADLICAVPYLLGFHPADSLVVVGLDAGTVVVTIRVDLEIAVTDPGAVGDSLAGMRRGGASQLVVLVYDDMAAPYLGQETLAWTDLVLDVIDMAQALEVEVSEVILVAEDRYWSYPCYGRGCCPDEGTAVVTATSEIPARATYAGMVALPDRAAVQRLLDPEPIEQRTGRLPLIEKALDRAAAQIAAGQQARLDRSDIRALFAAARRLHRGEPGEVRPERGGGFDEATAARFAVALRRIEVRDAIWTGVDDGRLPGDACWRHLARLLPEPYDAAPLFLIGWAAWRRGDGATAQIAAERTLDSDPDYSAADLLHAVLAAAVDPRSMPKIRRRGRKYDP